MRGRLPPVPPGAPVGHRAPARARVHQGHVLRGLRPGARPVPGGPGHPQAARGRLLTSRLVFDAAIRAGGAAGRQRARSGELSPDAAAAAAGRRHPEQRRPEGQPGAGEDPGRGGGAGERRAGGPSPRPSRGQVARRHGYPGLGAFVLPGRQTGPACAAISREAGLYKDWLSAISRMWPRRQPPRSRAAPGPAGRAVAACAHRLGFPDVPSYLQERHVQQRHTVSAMAAEIGVTHHAMNRRCAATAWTGSPTWLPGIRRASAPRRWLPARLRPHQPFLRERRRPAGRGGPWPPSPGQPESWLRRQAAGTRVPSACTPGHRGAAARGPSPRTAAQSSAAFPGRSPPGDVRGGFRRVAPLLLYGRVVTAWADASAPHP